MGGGAVLLNGTTLDDSGLPVPPDDYLGHVGRNLILVEIPADFQRIKRHEFELARRWREHTRTLFEALFNDDYMVTDFVFQPGSGGRNRSFYLLTHKDS